MIRLEYFPCIITAPSSDNARKMRHSIVDRKVTSAQFSIKGTHENMMMITGEWQTDTSYMPLLLRVYIV